VPSIRRISDFKPLFTNLAQTSHYEVKFGGVGLIGGPLMAYLSRKGISQRFIAEDAGLLCFSASLPTSSLATANISGNFMGITENFAHTRQYSAISLDFYVDKNYNALKFIETWMEFIASGSNNPIGSSLSPIGQNRKDYISRMQYPEYYKSDRTTITKFDRDYNKEIEYTFIGLFPSSMPSIPVSYSSSDILKMTVNFEPFTSTTNGTKYHSGVNIDIKFFQSNWKYIWSGLHSWISITIMGFYALKHGFSLRVLF